MAFIEPTPAVPAELAPAFNEIAARADAAQRLAILALEALAQEFRRQGRPWDLAFEADRMEAINDADESGVRGRVIAAALLRVLGDADATGTPLGRGT